MQGVSKLIYSGTMNGRRSKIVQLCFDTYKHISRLQTASPNPYLKPSSLPFSNRAMDMEDVGALILIPPPLLYYIILILLFLYSKVMFYHSPRGDVWSMEPVSPALSECQNLAIWSAASHGTGIRPHAGADLDPSPAGHVVSSRIKTG